jgi:hypothetical protein
MLGVRLRPHVIAKLREELGVPEDAGDAVLLREAVCRLTGIAPEEMAGANGGRRPGAGRPPRRPAAA